MGVAIHIRDVPQDVRDALATAAARQGQSMQAYLLQLLERHARLQRNAELFEHTAWARIDIPDHLQPAKITRQGRDAGFEGDRNRT